MIKSLGEKHPDTQKASFIAPDSAILGDVTLAEGTSVWYGAVIRGDLDHITIGKNSNVQDNCTLHGDRGYPITLGEGVSIGHNAVVHGATVGDNTVIGMGSVLLNGCVIGKNSIVGGRGCRLRRRAFPGWLPHCRHPRQSHFGSAPRADRA